MFNFENEFGPKQALPVCYKNGYKQVKYCSQMPLNIARVGKTLIKKFCKNGSKIVEVLPVTKHIFRTNPEEIFILYAVPSFILR